MTPPIHTDATFHTYGNTGCFWYRAHLPSKGLGAGLLQRDNLSDGKVALRRSRQPVSGSTVVYHMPRTDWQLDEVRLLKESGYRVLADIDDSLRDTTRCVADHPHHAGLLAGIPIQDAAISLCDGVIASTPFLAERLASQYGLPTFLCPNGIDPWRFKLIQRLKAEKRFVIGWQGGFAHDQAWQMIAPQVASFMRSCPEAVLLILGQALVPGTDLDDEDLQARTQTVPFHVEDPKFIEYARWVTRFSIGIAPAAPNDFYRGKSPLRLYEYQAAQIPALVSPTTYGDHIIDGKTGILVPDDGWEDALHYAARNRSKLNYMAQKGHRHMLDHDTIEHRLPQWAEALNG